MAHYRLGNLDGAQAAFRAALVSDPTAFPVHNDLGVVLGAAGDWAGAEEQFRRALGDQDDYPLAFHNLGVALEQQGAGELVESQAALARAAELDPDLQDHPRELLIDEEISFLDLDISDVDPGWEYATSRARGTVGLAGFAALAMIGHVLWAAGREVGTSKAKAIALGRGASSEPRRRRLGWLSARPHQAWAVGATLAVFLGPLLWFGGPSPGAAAFFGLGVVVLTGLYLRVRVAARARDRVDARGSTWVPGILVGAAAVLLGWGYAPLPVAETDAETRRLHRAGPVAIIVLGALLVTLGAVTQVPLTRATGAVAVTMAASVLVPVRPLDGATAARGYAGLAVSSALVLLAVLSTLSLL